MLTGTPIQNNLLELMSLLSFVMREMFAERVEGIKLLFGDSKVVRRFNRNRHYITSLEKLFW
jgi:SWI/SNF-related matrix-associated actin-dependent regulator 1 of chromatin subfamily A